MHSSGPSAPAQESRNGIHLADVETTEVLSTDEAAVIFSFLSHQDIMRARVCTAWKEAAKKTLVPLTEFVVDSNSLKSYNATRAMSTALPKLHWIKIVFDVAAGTVNYFVDATTVLPNFTKLRSLEIQSSDVSYYQEDCPLR